MRIAPILRFLFVALPGIVLMILAGPILLAPGIGPSVPPRAFAIPAGIAAIVIGAAMVLYGTARWGQWLYLLPFVALGAWFIIGLDMDTSGTISWILLILPFVLAAAVHRYYGRRQATP